MTLENYSTFSSNISRCTLDVESLISEVISKVIVIRLPWIA